MPVFVTSTYPRAPGFGPLVLQRSTALDVGSACFAHNHLGSATHCSSNRQARPNKVSEAPGNPTFPASPISRSILAHLDLTVPAPPARGYIQAREGDRGRGAYKLKPRRFNPAGLRHPPFSPGGPPSIGPDSREAAYPRRAAKLCFGRCGLPSRESWVRLVQQPLHAARRVPIGESGATGSGDRWGPIQSQG